MIPNTIIHAYTSNLKKMSNIDAQQSFCVRFALFYFPEESSQSFTWSILEHFVPFVLHSEGMEINFLPSFSCPINIIH